MDIDDEKEKRDDTNKVVIETDDEKEKEKDKENEETKDNGDIKANGKADGKNPKTSTINGNTNDEDKAPNDKEARTNNIMPAKSTERAKPKDYFDQHKTVPTVIPESARKAPPGYGNGNECEHADSQLYLNESDEEGNGFTNGLVMLHKEQDAKRKEQEAKTTRELRNEKSTAARAIFNAPVNWNKNHSHQWNLLSAAPTSMNIFWTAHHSVMLPALKHWLYFNLGIKVPIGYDPNARYKAHKTLPTKATAAEEKIRQTGISLLVQLEHIKAYQPQPQWTPKRIANQVQYIQGSPHLIEARKREQEASRHTTQRSSNHRRQLRV